MYQYIKLNNDFILFPGGDYEGLPSPKHCGHV